MSQFQKYWLSRVNHLFFRASNTFRRTNPDFFTKNGKKSNFGPFSNGFRGGLPQEIDRSAFQREAVNDLFFMRKG